MKKVLLGLFLSLVAFPLLAESVVAVDPIAPTSQDRISFRIPTHCSAETISVSRENHRIRIVLQLHDAICDPPLPSTHIVTIDPLPPGRYGVAVFPNESDAIYAQNEFVVRNGEPKTFEAHPFAIPVNAPFTTRVRLSRAEDGWSVCAVQDCEGVELFVDGTKVAFENDTGDQGLWFTPPNRSTYGFVDIELHRGTTVETQTAALYYYDRPDLSLFERVLFPVLTTTGGLNGSMWVSEATIANANPFYVTTPYDIAAFACIAPPCGTERIDPLRSFRFDGNGYPHGASLLVSREEADRLAYSLRVRDTSRVKEGFGASVPVARERDMSRLQPLVLADIPRDPRYRVKLRVYAIATHGETQAFPGMRIAADDAHLDDVETSGILLHGPGNVYEPLYGEYDLPPGSEGQRSTIFIDPASALLTWAFVTVTNNETQQVTIIEPDFAGMPCVNCGEPRQ